ncbi:hypothetical protein [Leptolyngbya sp. FACHB-261]|nr:hypothetical protein [Leptolyngbya sp. FACHB-261]
MSVQDDMGLQEGVSPVAGDFPRLVTVGEASVRATYLFLVECSWLQ